MRFSFSRSISSGGGLGGRLASPLPIRLATESPRDLISRLTSLVLPTFSASISSPMFATGGKEDLDMVPVFLSGCPIGFRVDWFAR